MSASLTAEQRTLVDETILRSFDALGRSPLKLNDIAWHVTEQCKQLAGGTYEFYRWCDAAMQRLKREGRVELVRGAGGGWIRTSGKATRKGPAKRKAAAKRKTQANANKQAKVRRKAPAKRKAPARAKTRPKAAARAKRPKAAARAKRPKAAARAKAPNSSPVKTTPKASAGAKTPTKASVKASGSYAPFRIDDIGGPPLGDRGSVRLSFFDWGWLEKQHGSIEIEGYYMNGPGVEGLVRAVMFANKIASKNVEGDSEGDACLLYFTDVQAATHVARLAAAMMKDRTQLAEAITIARKHGFEE
jgi:hypothetical protein